MYRRGIYMGRQKTEQLGHKQQMIMQCVWDLGGTATTQEIIERLDRMYGLSLSRQAMNSSTQVLIDKGYLLVTEKIGNAYVFCAQISQEEFRAQELKRFKDLTFGGSVKMMFAALIQEDISQDELQEIMEMIDKKHE